MFLAVTFEPELNLKFCFQFLKEEIKLQIICHTILILGSF